MSESLTSEEDSMRFRGFHCDRLYYKFCFAGCETEKGFVKVFIGLIG